ncbi:uncharacterized protein CXorf66 homolog [Loxodonta africana]|uniref:uncharacterized protein CXorf66 homolog n=1 Tax=Elephas maximus indicus TaxID=99487 RepID=UPI002115FBA3|nr:uncharacterized protein CXorf66 homolog [Elephas maximus indicus]
MTLFIYVLFLTIWISSCFNTSQSNVSSTVGATRLQSIETKMDSFRRRLLVIIVGIMIIAFMFTCFCFLHNNCMTEDIPRRDMIKKEGIAAKSSELPPSGSKTSSPCSPEKQSMLSCIDKSSEPLSPQKSSIPSRAEMPLRPSSPERSSIPSSAEKLRRLSSPEKSSRPSSGKLSRPPSLKKLLRSSRLEKLSMTSGVEKNCKLTHTRKQVSQICLSYSDKPVRPLCPKNKIWPLESSSLPKLAKPPRHPNPKRSGSRDKTNMLSRSQLPKTCRWYKERCLVCRASEPWLEVISEAKNNIAQTPPFSGEGKHLSQSFYSTDNAFCKDVSDSDKMTHDSDNDSDKEITIICNIKHNSPCSHSK